MADVISSKNIPSVAPFSKDTATSQAVVSMAKTLTYTGYGFIALLLFWVVGVWINAGVGNAVFTLFLSAIIFIFGFNLIIKFIISPIASARYSNCVKRMQSSLTQIGLHPSLQWSWRKPTPGVFAIDMQQRLLYLVCSDTGYTHVIIEPDQIISSKVERKTELHTHTKHSGRPSLFSSSGFGYTFGGSSKSKTSVIESAFLEIHYSLENNDAPYFVAIPFYNQRRQAESFSVAIAQIKQ